MAQPNQQQNWDQLFDHVEETHAMATAICRHLDISQQDWMQHRQGRAENRAHAGDKPAKGQQTGQRGTQAGNR